MQRIRQSLLQAFVCLTAAATLLAGTPYVQCRCPSGAVKAVCAAPAPAEGCCCCTKSPGEPGATPSCCQQPTTLDDDPTVPAFRQGNCQKEVVAPADATMQRINVEGPEAFGLELAAVESMFHNAIAPVQPVSIDIPPLPPPVDRQLLLQHFVI